MDGLEWPIRLAKMRNPHGAEREWKDTEEDWKKVSGEERQRIGLDWLEDGEFFMPWKHVVTRMYKLSVVRENMIKRKFQYTKQIRLMSKKAKLQCCKSQSVEENGRKIDLLEEQISKEKAMEQILSLNCFFLKLIRMLSWLLV